MTDVDKKNLFQGHPKKHLADFRRTMDALGPIFGHFKPLTEDSARLYLSLLDAYVWATIEDAIQQHCKTSSAYPTPAHLLSLMNGKPLESRYPDESSRRQAAALELSKPTWERHGFDSQEDLNAYNKKKWEEGIDTKENQ